MGLTKKQETTRRRFITGTDIAGILGLSPFQTPADVWMQKIHPDLCAAPTEKQAEQFWWGNRHEASIKDAYEERNKVKLVKPDFMVHPKIKWLGGSPDFLVEGKPLGVEAKTSEVWNRSEWGPPNTDQVPLHYLLQCEHYMSLTGYEEWEVAALVGLYGYQTYHLFADVDLQGMMLEAAEAFYKAFITGDQTPEFDAGTQVRAYLKKKWPKSIAGKVIEVDPYGDAELKAALRKLCAIKAQKAVAEKAEESAKVLVAAHMQDAEQLIWNNPDTGKPDMIVRYGNNRDGTKVDWESIALAAMQKLAVQDRKALMAEHTGIEPGKRPMKLWTPDTAEAEK